MTNKTIYYFFIGIMIINIFVNVSKAETIIYDNITSSNYKLLKISSDTINVKYLNEYPYEVYFNNSFVGYYKIGENIFVPDNISVQIYVPSPVRTDVSNLWNTIMLPTLITFLGFIFSWGLGIIIILIVIFKIYKEYIRR